MLAVWFLVPLPFLKPAWTCGSSRFMYCWSLAWRILSITLLACKMSAIVWHYGHSLALPFFGIGMKTELFQSCGHCWVFQICWHIERSTVTASSFRTWRRSGGISSLLCSQWCFLRPTWLRTPGCLAQGEWSRHPGYLGHEDLFCTVNSSVYSCHLFLISSASVRFIPFLSFIVLIFAWNVPLVSLIFLKRSLVFPVLLFSSISLHWSLRKAFLFLPVILWSSAFRWIYLSFFPFYFSSIHSHL